MKGQRIGYIRVSSFDQNPERQLDQTLVDKVFVDKASGKDTQRPELDSLLSFMRNGDSVVVHSMNRLARNLGDLRRLVNWHCCKALRIDKLDPIFISYHATQSEWPMGFSVPYC